jgi:CO/xanthine dehydrogenase FAD-binding subunit
MLEMRAQHPEYDIIAGGTDLMVSINMGHHRPAGILDVTAVPELLHSERSDREILVGSRVTFTALRRQFREQLPALAAVARTVGSPQIQRLATVGGNVATASPAGDSLPVLIAADAVIHLASTEGERTVPAREFFLAPGKTRMTERECILGIGVRGCPSEQFAKVGARNAMVISVASFALQIDPHRRRVGTGMGSVGPKPLYASAAERFLEPLLFDGDPGRKAELTTDQIAHFGDLVAEACQPIDDMRGSARYRRHVTAVLARRTLSRLVGGAPGGGRQ